MFQHTRRTENEWQIISANRTTRSLNRKDNLDRHIKKHKAENNRCHIYERIHIHSCHSRRYLLKMSLKDIGCLARKRTPEI